MSELMNIKNDGQVEQYQEAISLHREIMANLEVAANSLFEMCKGLKIMRDKKLYIELGYENFDSYCEEMANIKSRQAYSYISSYEKLGSKFLQANASLGITKLELIASVPPTERADFMEENDIEGLSTREIKEIIEKYKQQGEQISLLQEQLQSQDDSEDLENELNKKSDEIIKLQKQIKDLENRPVDVAVQDPDPKQIKELEKAAADKAKEKALKEAQKKIDEAKAEAQKQLAEAVKKAKAEAAQEHKKALEDIEREKQRSLERAKELEAKLMLSSSPDTTAFTIHFSDFQEVTNKLLGLILKMKNSNLADVEKFKGAMQKYLEIIAQKLGE